MFCPLTGQPCNKLKTIHVTDMQEGQIGHLHICHDCANNLEQITNGIAIEPPLPLVTKPDQLMPLPGSPESPLSFFMQLMNDFDQRYKEQELMQMPCPICGHTLLDVKKTGKIGCPNCYTFFKKHLGPLIQKVQEGNVKHIGKKPQPKRDSKKQIQCSLDTLQKKMDTAVKEERYEDAAVIRDQMAALKKKQEFGVDTNDS